MIDLLDHDGFLKGADLIMTMDLQEIIIIMMEL